MTIAVIPTMYAGIQFRSRLEAKWAAVFDQLGWKWTYEPCDYDGWIPDFVLHLHKPVLVEVKPALSEKELKKHTDKIDLAFPGQSLCPVHHECHLSSIWVHDCACAGCQKFREAVAQAEQQPDVLLVGAALLTGPTGFGMQLGDFDLGLLRQGDYWANATCYICPKEAHLTAYHGLGGYDCLVCGRHLNSGREESFRRANGEWRDADREWRDLFAKASNTTQWRSPRAVRR